MKDEACRAHAEEIGRLRGALQMIKTLHVNGVGATEVWMREVATEALNGKDPRAPDGFPDVVQATFEIQLPGSPSQT